MLGQIGHNEGTPGTKDAFHVPCALVIANETISPGDPVIFLSDDCEEVQSSDMANCHGIADPFVGVEILAGIPFWVLIDPKKVSRIRHQFDVNDIPYDPDGIGCGTRCG